MEYVFAEITVRCAEPGCKDFIVFDDPERHAHNTFSINLDDIEDDEWMIRSGKPYCPHCKRQFEAEDVQCKRDDDAYERSIQEALDARIGK